MPVAVFAYGSLMFPQVWERVVSGRYPSAAVSADGFQRYCVSDETYPGMIRREGDSVRGFVHFDVAAHDLAALDAFEGEDYRRENIEVRFNDGRRMVVAAYIYLPVARLTMEIWKPEAFQLDRFLQTYCRQRLTE